MIRHNILVFSNMKPDSSRDATATHCSYDVGSGNENVERMDNVDGTDRPSGAELVLGRFEFRPLHLSTSEYVVLSPVLYWITWSRTKSRSPNHYLYGFKGNSEMDNFRITH